MKTRVSFVAFALASASPAQAEVPRASLGGYMLGMTIDEAKAVPVLAANEIKLGSGDQAPSPGYFTCQGEKKASEFLGDDKFIREAGIVECAAQNRSNFIDYQVFGTSLVAGVEYKFFEGALFKMQATFRKPNLETVKDSLVGKFGNAKSVETGEVQNRMGASFASIRLTWLVGPDEIVLESPGSRIDEFRVVYRQSEIDDRLTKQVKAAKAAASGL